MIHPGEPSLKRSLSLPLLTLYGLGTILGAGIYVLIGEVAGNAGMRAPLAFLAAGVVAGFTGFSYAELSSRIPRSAGEAAYAGRAFRSRLPALGAGLGVVLTGIVSAATIANGFVGYLREFLPAHRELTIVVTVLCLGSLAAWGVTESVIAAAVVTALEVIGIGLVLALTGSALGDFPARAVEFAPRLEWPQWTGLITAAYLAFFAFIGFEDIVNMAEETKRPERTLPRAILLSLGISTALYMLVATVAVLAMPPAEIARAEAPFAALLARHGKLATTTISLISLVAVINGALIQVMMAARVLYGMAAQGLAPRPFAAVHPVRRTPLLATGVVTAAVLLLATALPLVSLAAATSTVTLLVFALMNASLLRIKMTADSPPAGSFRVPAAVPGIGLLLCLAALALQGALRAGWL
ncbi:MAG: amino acid permease [Akkermansiaceae bacterium]|nr:amino acid permease [Akkermansiaceae bacterium]